MAVTDRYFSNAYYDAVEKGRQYHLSSKSWTGLHTVPYADAIRELTVKHNIKSLLDYGCGKGQQYLPYEWEPGVCQPLDKYLGVEEVYKFDPCVDEFSTPPPLNKKFDAVILIQCIGFIPDFDLEILKKQLMNWSTKFCFIGERHSDTPGSVKPKKLALRDADYYTLFRSKQWYQDRFANWQESELVLHWLEDETKENK
jgi:hypothetical protein